MSRCHLQCIHSPAEVGGLARVLFSSAVPLFGHDDDFSWQAQEIGAALLRCADFVAGTVLLDMVMVFGML